MSGLLPRVLWTSSDEQYRVVECLHEDEGHVYALVERRASYDAMGERGWRRACCVSGDHVGMLPARYAAELARAEVPPAPRCVRVDCDAVAVEDGVCSRHRWEALRQERQREEIPF